jgi:hypothetical protein
VEDHLTHTPVPPRAILDRTDSKWPRIATLLVAGATAAFLLYGWDTLLPQLLVPLMIGGAVGLSAETRFEALVAGLGAALVGSLGAAISYSSWTTLPALRSQFSGGSAWVLVACAVVLTPGAALGVRMLAERFAGDRLKRVAAWVISAVLAASFLFTMWAPTQSWIANARIEPVSGTYRTDQMVNLKVYYLMQAGEGFYQAYANATGGDARQLYPVRDGKFVSASSAMLRQPATFYLWKVVAPRRDFGAVAYLAMIAAALLLAGSYWAFSAVVGYRALFVAPIIFPALVLHCSGANTLFPEWWALLALLAGVLCAVRKRMVLAGVFGLLALVLRETFGAWLLALALASVVLALRDKRMWRYVGLYAGLLALGVGGYLLHTLVGRTYISHPTTGFVVTYLLAAAQRPISERLFAPLAYLMYPYGFLSFSAAWLVVPGIVGLWVGLRRAPFARLASFLYLAFFLGYLVILGAPSPYWGQAVMPLVLVGIALLLVSLDRLAENSSWRWSESD